MSTSLFRAKTWAVMIFVFLAAAHLERGACLARNADVPGPSAILQYAVLM